MWDDLASIDPRFAYNGERTRYIAFPLGGIGSGGFSISGSGRLVDWSIRNRPALQGYNGYSHFAIKAEKGGELVDARVLNGPYDLNPSGAPGLRKMFDGFGHGANRQTLVGVPHFREVDFYGRFPTADLVFKDERFPGGVRMTALSPFIPHNDRDSSMPVAMFEFELVNDTADELTYTLAGTLGNYGSNSGIHTFERKDGVSTLHLTSSDQNLKPADRGDLTIATDADDVDHTDYHYRGQWFDDLAVFWKEFARPGRLPERHYDKPRPSRHMSLQPEHGTLAARVTVPAGGRKKVRFVISWSFPVGDVYWAFRNKPDGADPRQGDADLAQLLRHPVGGFAGERPRRAARWDELAGDNHRLPRRRLRLDAAGRDQGRGDRDAGAAAHRDRDPAGGRRDLGLGGPAHAGRLLRGHLHPCLELPAGAVASLSRRSSARCARPSSPTTSCRPAG